MATTPPSHDSDGLHPTPDSDFMDAVFKALASRARRQILDIVKSSPGCNVNDVCAHFSMSRIAVMKHLGVLEEADLIVSEKEGRSRKLYFNVVPIQLIYDRWTTEYSALWARRLAALKARVEGPWVEASRLEESLIDPISTFEPRANQGDDHDEDA